MIVDNFVDYVKINVKSGSGGKGSTHLRREKYIPKGGPDGGDGGRGGHVIIRANPQLWTLFTFKFKKHFKAGNGGDGSGSRKSGLKGKDVVVEVPYGTIIKDSISDKVIEEIIFASIQTKAKIVTMDERENGIRAILNFGHTFGHAIEAHGKYKKILHGEAIAKGMKIASKISYLENLITEKDHTKIIDLLHLYEFDLSLNQYKFQKLKPYIFRDKKIKAGRLNLVLLDQVSNAVVTNSFNIRNLQKGFKD